MKLKWIALSLLLLLGTAACGTTSPAPTPPEPAEPDVLVGDWEPKGIAFGGKLYRLDDIPELASLYGGAYLTIKDDGTFVFFDIFMTEGTWTTTWMEGKEHAYTLQSQCAYRMTVEEDGDVVRADEQAKDTCYRMWQPGDDPDTMAFSDPDSDDIFHYVRSGAEGRYLDENCAELPASVKS